MMMMRNGIAKSFFKSFLRRESGPFAARVVVHPNVHSFALDDDDDEALEKGTTLFLHHALKNNNEEVKEKPSCFRTPHLQSRLRRLALEDY